jgi:hypothetical protein
MSDVSSTIYERDLMKTKGYPSSNLDRTWQNERMGLDRGGAAAEEVRWRLWGLFLDAV